VKTHIKRVLQHTAARCGPHTHRFGAPRLLILMYHRILPAEDPSSILEEPGMIVTPDSLKMHLETLQDYLEFMALEEWVDRRSQARPLPPIACAITFDDGWADNYEYAYPILASMQIPATIYLVSAMIGKTETFWPERLARLIKIVSDPQSTHIEHQELDWLHALYPEHRRQTSLPDRETISAIIQRAKQYTDETINGLLDAAEESVGIAASALDPVSADILNWEQINTLADSGLVSFGSHTCHHLRLTPAIPEATLIQEIVDSKKVIEEKTAAQVSSFCYPNGDYTDQALSCVRQNYRSAVTTRSGWNTKNSDAHTLKRIALHEDISSDPISFLARVSGWL